MGTSENMKHQSRQLDRTVDAIDTTIENAKRSQKLVNKLTWWKSPFVRRTNTTNTKTTMTSTTTKEKKKKNNKKKDNQNKVSDETISSHLKDEKTKATMITTTKLKNQIDEEEGSEEEKNYEYDQDMALDTIDSLLDELQDRAKEFKNEIQYQNTKLNHIQETTNSANEIITRATK